MSFQTGLSGLNALQQKSGRDRQQHRQCQHRGHEIFAHRVLLRWWPVQLGVGGGRQPDTRASASRLAAIAQQFTQGNINITGNNLDVAINGEWFLSGHACQTNPSPTPATASSSSTDSWQPDHQHEWRKCHGLPHRLAGQPHQHHAAKDDDPNQCPHSGRARQRPSQAEFNLDARSQAIAAQRHPAQHRSPPPAPHLTAYDSQGS